MKTVVTALLTLMGAVSVTANETIANIEYLCADWGPAEEIYFLKQVTTFKREKLAKPELLSGKTTQDMVTHLGIYLCKMKPDGTQKTEIKELWANPAYPIDTQGQTTWMDVNDNTRKIVLAIAFAGGDTTGLWTMNLNGSGLKRIITPERTENYLQAINKPSWTPDGRWIVFEEELRGMNPNRFNIARCNDRGTEFSRILTGTESDSYRQPAVSPDGKQVLCVHGFKGASWLYLINLDGSKQRHLPNAENKQWGTHGGVHPSWSPDGRRIYAIGISSFIADVETGKKLIGQSPQLNGKRGICGWPHWGKLGFVGFGVGGILVTDSELKEAKWVASTGVRNCPTSEPDDCKW